MKLKELSEIKNNLENAHLFYEQNKENYSAYNEDKRPEFRSEIQGGYVALCSPVRGKLVADFAKSNVEKWEAAEQIWQEINENIASWMPVCLKYYKEGKVMPIGNMTSLSDQTFPTSVNWKDIFNDLPSIS